MSWSSSIYECVLSIRHSIRDRQLSSSEWPARNDTCSTVQPRVFMSTARRFRLRGCESINHNIKTPPSINIQFDMTSSHHHHHWPVLTLTVFDFLLFPLVPPTKRQRLCAAVAVATLMVALFSEIFVCAPSIGRIRNIRTVFNSTLLPSHFQNRNKHVNSLTRALVTTFSSGSAACRRFDSNCSRPLNRLFLLNALN